MATTRILVRNSLGLVERVVEAEESDPLLAHVSELVKERDALRDRLAESERLRVTEVNRERNEVVQEVVTLRSQLHMLTDVRDHVYEDLKRENAGLRETVARLQTIAERAVLNGTHAIQNSTRIAGQAVLTVESALKLNADPYNNAPSRRPKAKKKRDPDEEALNRFAESLYR